MAGGQAPQGSQETHAAGAALLGRGDTKLGEDESSFVGKSLQGCHASSNRCHASSNRCHAQYPHPSFTCQHSGPYLRPPRPAEPGRARVADEAQRWRREGLGHQRCVAFDLKKSKISHSRKDPVTHAHTVLFLLLVRCAHSRKSTARKRVHVLAGTFARWPMSRSCLACLMTMSGLRRGTALSEWLVV